MLSVERTREERVLFSESKRHEKMNEMRQNNSKVQFRIVFVVTFFSNGINRKIFLFYRSFVRVFFLFSLTNERNGRACEEKNFVDAISIVNLRE